MDCLNFLAIGGSTDLGGEGSCSRGLVSYRVRWGESSVRYARCLARVPPSVQARIVATTAIGVGERTILF